MNACRRKPLLTTILTAATVVSLVAILVPRTASAVEVQGRSYSTWTDYYLSSEFQTGGRRCGTAPSRFDTSRVLPPSDCSFTNTTPASEYDSVDTYLINVVVHIIQNTSGDGNIPDSQVDASIDILNEDFLALAATPGAPGYDTKIQFQLATTDPNGDPTTGITRSTNNTWFNDGGNYWDSLAWDTNRYMNVYTNEAGGNLGYVPNLPQGGIAGSNADRVVVLWSAFGRNASGGPPYDQGRTLTHEVGHYLGLEHTFNGGCAAASPPNCYTSGDLICDTNSESNPNYGCPSNPTSCSSPDPKTNYMDYTDDTCMNQFTDEQSHRMRCSLIHYRTQLYSVVSAAVCGDDTREGAEECDGTDDSACPGLCTVNCECPAAVCGNNVIETGEECDGTDPGTCPTGTCGVNCECPAAVCGNDIIETGEECDGTDPGTCPTGTCTVNCECPAPVCGNDVTETDEECDGTDDSACPGLCDGSCICPATCNETALFTTGIATSVKKFKAKYVIDNFSDEFNNLDPRNGFDYSIAQGVTTVSLSIPTLDPGWANSKPNKGKYKWKGLIGGFKVVKWKDLSNKTGEIRVVLVGKNVAGSGNIDYWNLPTVFTEVTADGACASEEF